MLLVGGEFAAMLRSEGDILCSSSSSEGSASGVGRSDKGRFPSKEGLTVRFAGGENGCGEWVGSFSLDASSSFSAPDSGSSYISGGGAVVALLDLRSRLCDNLRTEFAFDDSLSSHLCFASSTASFNDEGIGACIDVMRRAWREKVS